jgi:DNA polymerase IV
MSADASQADKEVFYSRLGWLDAIPGSMDEIPKEDCELRNQNRKFFKQAPARHKPTAASHETATKQVPRVDLTAVDDSLNGQPKASNTALTALSPTVIKATPGSDKPKQAKHLSGSNSFIQDTPCQRTHPSAVAKLRRRATNPPSLNSTHVTASPPQPDASTESRKHKLEPGFLPQDQILRGLRFFYIQGDRKGLRKLRMERAEEYGAEVTSVLADATHVIVDDELTFEDIKDRVASVISQDQPLLIRTHWPLDSINEKRLLPTTSSWYQVIPDSSTPAVSTAEQPPKHSLDVIAARNDSSRQEKDPHFTPLQIEKYSAPQNKSYSEVGVGTVSAHVTAPYSQPILGDEASGADPTTNHPVGHDYGDELSRMIKDVQKKYRDLPSLECDDDENDKQDKDEDSDGNSECEKKGQAKRIKKTKVPKPRVEDNFACSRGGTMDKPNGPNARTVMILQQLCDYYYRTNNHYRALSYRRAINTLSEQPEKVTMAKEAEMLPFIGGSIGSKIEEIVKTDRLQILEHTQNDANSQVLQLFLGIYGVGLSTANQWMAKGFRTLDDLLRHAPLTPNQRIGVEHYKDLNTRIQRSEVKALGDHVKDEAAKIDKDIELLIGGSYRRGADSSSDIDIIITKAGTKSSEELTPFLEALLANLMKKGFLTATLASHNQRSSSNRDNNGSKWHGCCVLPSTVGFYEDGKDGHSPWRRIDFLLVYVHGPSCKVEFPHVRLCTSY